MDLKRMDNGWLMDGQKDGWMDGRTGGWMDGQRGEPIDK